MANSWNEASHMSVLQGTKITLADLCVLLPHLQLAIAIVFAVFVYKGNLPLAQQWVKERKAIWVMQVVLLQLLPSQKSLRMRRKIWKFWILHPFRHSCMMLLSWLLPEGNAYKWVDPWINFNAALQLVKLQYNSIQDSSTSPGHGILFIFCDNDTAINQIHEIWVH